MIEAHCAKCGTPNVCSVHGCAAEAWSSPAAQAISEQGERDLIAWLMERRDNCRRVAASIADAEKAGWLEDAGYFDRAIYSLASLPAPMPEPAEPKLPGFDQAAWEKGYQDGIHAATPAAVPRAPEQIEREMARMEEHSALRTALEVIALGESKNPGEDAAAMLVDLGLWSAEAVAAGAHRASPQPEAAGEQKTSSGWGGKPGTQGGGYGTDLDQGKG